MVYLFHVEYTVFPQRKLKHSCPSCQNALLCAPIEFRPIQWCTQEPTYPMIRPSLHSHPIRLISPSHKHTFAFSSHTEEAVPVGGGGADMIRVVSGRTGSSLAVRCVCGCRCVWNRKSAGCRLSAMCVWEAGGGPARMADIPGECVCVCVWESPARAGGLTGLGASAQLDAPLPEEKLGVSFSPSPPFPFVSFFLSPFLSS